MLLVAWIYVSERITAVRAEEKRDAMLPRMPTSPSYTAVLVVGCIALLAYILASHATLGYIIAAVVLVLFIVPAIVIAMLTRADARAVARREMDDGETLGRSEDDTPEREA